MSGDHLIDRPARLITCHGCGAHILAAVAGGRTVAADPQSITLTAEIAARLSGQHSYDVVTSGRTFYLVYRDQFRIRGSRESPVVGEHGCGAVPRYQLIPPKKPPVKKKQAPAVGSLLERIPFLWLR